MYICLFMGVYMYGWRCISIFKNGKRSTGGGCDRAPASRGRGSASLSTLRRSEGMRIPRVCGRLPAQWRAPDKAGRGEEDDEKEEEEKEGGRLRLRCSSCSCCCSAADPRRPRPAGHRPGGGCSARCPARPEEGTAPSPPLEGTGPRPDAGGRLPAGSPRSLRGSATRGGGPRTAPSAQGWQQQSCRT